MIKEKLIEAFHQMLESPNLSRKEFTQMVAGVHSNNIIECSGWRHLAVSKGAWSLTLTIERGPGYCQIYTGDVRSDLTETEANELLTIFHDKKWELPIEKLEEIL